MAIHTIRLRAPWNLQRRDDCDLWLRSFGRPSNLSEEESLRLVLRCESASALVTLNDEMLGSAGAGDESAFDVTGRLEVRNVLVLSMETGGPPGADRREPPVDVRLEIVS